jgi:hypothetical protein
MSIESLGRLGALTLLRDLADPIYERHIRVRGGGGVFPSEIPYFFRMHVVSSGVW